MKIRTVLLALAVALLFCSHAKAAVYTAKAKPLVIDNVRIERIPAPDSDILDEVLIIESRLPLEMSGEGLLVMI